jgi:hypothetical protein
MSLSGLEKNAPSKSRPAKIDDTEIPVTCVVWNPGRTKARKIADFGSAGWMEMIGVQPGILERQMLQPNQTLVFEYTIKLLAQDNAEEGAWSRAEAEGEAPKAE